MTERGGDWTDRPPEEEGQPGGGVAPEPFPAERPGAGRSGGASPEASSCSSSSAPPPSSRRSRRRDSVLEIAVVVLAALFLALLLKQYVAEAYMIRGQSMQPTFVDGERVMVQKVGYEIERGDIIIFASKLDPRKDLIKRVIGLPGERVFVKSNGEVLIDGEPLDEEYIRRTDPPRAEFGPEVVPPGTYFVLGDNRPQSQDSRYFHSIRAESIKGKVILRWWPLEDLSTF